MEQTNEQRVSRKTNLSIIGTAGLAFCGVLVETSMNVTFPTLMRDFHQGLNAVQWVATGYLLAVALTVVLAAFLQRRFKLRSLIITSTLAFIVGGLLCALAPQLWVLLLGRLIQGISTGLAMPLLFFIIMQQVPFAMQGTYAGLGGMVIGLAPSLGPTYGGLITQFINWRVIFRIVLPIGIIFGLNGIVNVQQLSKPTAIRFQLLQYLLVAIGFICLEMGLNNAGTSGFGYLTSHREHPLVNTNVFADSIYLPCLLLYFMVQFIQIGMTFLLPNCAQLTLHQNSFVVGLMLLLGALISAVLLPLTGRLLDQSGIKKPLIFGALFTNLAVILMYVFSGQLSMWSLTIFYAVYMVGFGFLFNNVMTYGLQHLKPQLVGDGNALFSTLQQYAGSIGTAGVSTILAITAAQLPHQSTVVQTAMGTKYSYVLFIIGALIMDVLIIDIWKQIGKEKHSFELLDQDKQQF
ncbi:multidrug efflux MFS transporter [Lactobacillus sp. MRS-253-APC-2B]|uniref:MFS transporter n=1 Tax=Lactobacillus sp. MRS-253-APC-2B TaxID=2725305 RepID=UPI001469D065|nr:MFS transporter [Lactobacillus sp. MRS-253-APC-2B]NME34742.1 multidrug efflux MFS transporter [Lactobacillus sp. MRS-253-APC-2B]